MVGITRYLRMWSLGRITVWELECGFRVDIVGEPSGYYVSLCAVLECAKLCEFLRLHGTKKERLFVGELGCLVDFNMGQELREFCKFPSEVPFRYIKEEGMIYKEVRI